MKKNLSGSEKAKGKSPVKLERVGGATAKKTAVGLDRSPKAKSGFKRGQ